MLIHLSESELKRMGRKWAKAREAQDLTQAAMGRALGLTGSYMSLIESGRRVPDIAVVRAAARLLKVTVEELFP